MNLKKFVGLKHESPYELQLTEKEEELYNSILDRVESNSAQRTVTKKRVSMWKIVTPVVSVLCAVAITLTCVFTLKAPTDFRYNDEYVESEESTFIALQTDTKCFDLSYFENYKNQVSFSYDLKSNDKLYYSNFVNLESSTINLVVVINEKYNYTFDLKSETTDKQLTDYTVTYCSESSRGDPQINYRGYIKVKTETVYFDYIQTPALGDDAFFESIQQIIKIKK